MELRLKEKCSFKSFFFFYFKSYFPNRKSNSSEFPSKKIFLKSKENDDKLYKALTYLPITGIIGKKDILVL